jgi:hypothetical protein
LFEVFAAVEEEDACQANEKLTAKDAKKTRE